MIIIIVVEIITNELVTLTEKLLIASTVSAWH